MATAEQLLVRIDATTEQLRRELKRGETAVGSFAGNVNSRLASIDKTFSGIGAGIGKINGLLGAIGVGIGIAALVNLGRSALDLADDLQDTAAQLGISTEALQVFRFAAAETGVEAGQLDQAILKLTNTIGEAASGDETAEKKFKALGIAFTDASGAARSSQAVLDDLANLIQSLSSPAERAAAAATLLGERAGPRLVPLLADGAQGLRDYGEAAHKANQVLGDETLATLAKAQREIEKFTNSLTIAAGEVIAFFSEAASVDEQFGLERQIKRTVDRIDELREAINLAKSGGGGIFAGLEDVPELEAEMERLIRLRNELFGQLDSKPQGHAGRGITFAPTTPAGSLNLGGDGDAAAKKLESALDSVRLKIAQTSADLADDPLGKALAENFDRAGLSLDDFSARAERMRILTELQVELQTRLGIATDGLTAAREADREAVADWNKVQEEGKQITEDLQTPTEEFAATVQRLSFLLQEGAISAETYARGLEKAMEELDGTQELLEDFFDQSFDRIGSGITEALATGQIEMAKFGDIGRAVISELIQLMIKLSLINPLKNALGIGDGNAPEIGNLFGLIKKGISAWFGGGFGGSGEAVGGQGFATGGSFKVGGSGGTDSKFVGFRATPGEMVNVMRPGQSSGDGVVLSVTNNISVQGSGDSEADNAFADQIARRVNMAVEAAVNRSISNKMRYGGALHSAFNP
jgi:hypothetical protein